MKIAHVSDTHLGKRPKQTRAGIINQETRSIEDDFYFSWTKFVNEMVDTNNQPDVILHCGDFFDSPSGLDPNSPPEYARLIAMKTFKQLRDSNIPLIMIDGNHGRYVQYRSSTLAEYPIAFDNICLFTYYDLREALRLNKPLFKDLSDLNLRIIAHPAIEARLLSTLGIYSLYEKWIELQNNTIHSDMINVGMAHGIVGNHTLDANFLNGNYDYIALGDDHRMQKVTDRAWYSGSPQLWSFNEYGDEKGYLIVELGERKEHPKVIKKKIDLPRKIISEEVKISQHDITSTIIDNVKKTLSSQGLYTKFDYNTAARVRLVLVGDKTYGASYNISEVEAYLRKLTLETDDYNIAEFVIDSPSYSAFTQIHPDQAVSNTEFLIEDPEREFKKYISSMRSDDIKKENLDPSFLARLFASVLSTGGIKLEDT